MYWKNISLGIISLILLSLLTMMLVGCSGTLGGEPERPPGGGGGSSHSLNGAWTMDGNPGVVSAVNGSTGTLSSINFTSGLMIDAVNKGYIKRGDQIWRNLTSTGNLTWSGHYLQVTYNTSNPDVATGTAWVNCTYTMSANGQTLNITGGQTGTWIRR